MTTTMPADSTEAAAVTLHYVSADDWAALYRDDECIHQNHRIDRDVWFELLAAGGPYIIDQTHSESEHAYEIADTDGQFPRTWTEFVAWTER